MSTRKSNDDGKHLPSEPVRQKRPSSAVGKPSAIAPDIIYRLNEKDEIVFVNKAWDEFALNNEGPDVTAARILQRPIWDFVVDLTTQEIYRQIIKRARAGTPVLFNFRCDAPDCRRLLEMHVKRRHDGTVEFRTRTLLLEPREPVVLQENHFDNTSQLLRACSWCKKVCLGESWEEIEIAVVRLQLFDHDSRPLINHGICEPCYKKMMGVVGQHKARTAA